MHHPKGRTAQSPYGMTDGRVVIRYWLAMLFYTLQTLNSDHKSTPRKGEQQLVIENLEDLKRARPRPRQA